MRNDNPKTECVDRSKFRYENYVCGVCYHKLKECTCGYPSSTPPHSLIWIDENMQEIIRLFNEKRYQTIGCCEGHKGGYCIYIAFLVGYQEIIETVPDELTKPKKYSSHPNTYFHDFSPKLTEEQFEEEKKKYLQIFLEWAKSIPVASGNLGKSCDKKGK